jgi:hypothetical protein
LSVVERVLGVCVCGVAPCLVACLAFFLAISQSLSSSPAGSHRSPLTVTSETGFRILLTLQLSGAPVLGVLALTPCLLPRSNIQHSPTQYVFALLHRCNPKRTAADCHNVLQSGADDSRNVLYNLSARYNVMEFFFFFFLKGCHLIHFSLALSVLSCSMISTRFFSNHDRI